MTLSTFNLIFSLYLSGKHDIFDKYNKDINSICLYRQFIGIPSVDLNDPLFDEKDAVRYTKCVEEGIKRGIIIIMRTSFVINYVYDDGSVFGERIVSEGSNYWVFAFETDLIKADLLN